MEQNPCIYCGDFFEPSPRHKNQTACKKPECQKAKKAAWQRYKMKHDAVCQANQKTSHQKWLKANPGYWKDYREKNPKKAERNRILQTIRNRKARSCHSKGYKTEWPIAKMDASKLNDFKVLGQFWMVPVIAKMDALKVNIVKVPIGYP
jgi:hypothetical protein